MFAGIIIFARRLDWLRRIGLSLLVPYVFLVLAVTVFLRSSSESAQIILEPFYSYKEYFTNDFTWFEIRANILLFIPIGFLLPMAVKKPVFVPLLVGVGFSVTIECLQCLLHRGTCETDDVISNTIGLLIGFGAFWILKAAVLLVKHIVLKIKEK